MERNSNSMKAGRISEKGIIGVFSSSSPVSATVPIRYERGKKYLENKGFKRAFAL